MTSSAMKTMTTARIGEFSTGRMMIALDRDAERRTRSTTVIANAPQYGTPAWISAQAR